MKGKQKKNQAEMIRENQRENMTFKETGMSQMKREGFVNKGAYSHGVEEGPDRRNADNEHVSREDVRGYGFKGYNPKAWEY